MKATAAFLRTADEHGGLDGYLLNTPDRKLDGAFALELKRQVQARLGIVKPTKDEICQQRIKQAKERDEMVLEMERLRVV